MIREVNNKVELDHERLMEIAGLAWDTVADTLGIAPYKSKELFLDEVSRQVTNGMTLQFLVELTSARMGDFYIRVDPRKKKVLGISLRFPTLKNRINGLLRLL